MNLHGIQKLHWEVAVGSDASFEDVFFVWMAVVVDFTSMTSALRRPNKMVMMPK